MLRKCPQHGFEDWFQVQLFYGGLNVATKAQIDACTGGSILTKTPPQVIALFEDMAMNSCQWQTEHASPSKTPGVLSVDQSTAVLAQLSMMNNHFKNMGLQTKVCNP